MKSAYGWVSMLVLAGTVVSVTGQTVVDSTIVSVVTEGVLADARQSGSDVGHAIIVAVLVVKTVEVVILSVSGWI